MRRGYLTVETRFMAIETLRLLKDALGSYKALSKATGLPTSSLVRYLTGRSLPSEERCAQIMEIQRSMSATLNKLYNQLWETGHEFSLNPTLNRLVAWEMTNILIGGKVTALLALDPAILPATALASEALHIGFTYGSHDPNGHDEPILYGHPIRALWIPTRRLKGHKTALTATRLDKHLLERVVETLENKGIEVTAIIVVFGRPCMIRKPGNRYLSVKVILEGEPL